MRKQIIGSSWKMHINSLDEGVETAKRMKELVGSEERVEIFFIPTFPLIPFIGNVFQGSKIKWGAQNMCYEERGAYTGEVPPRVLKDIGCSYVELGHAERRAYFNEKDELINRKTKLSMQYDIIPVVCIGEDEYDKIHGIGKVKLLTQTLWALDGLSTEEMKKVILAYEPVWAIGKEKSASEDYVEDIHRYIREQIKNIYGKDVAEEIRIIYGGSVSPNNAEKLMSKENIDGLFIGRFGLNSENFKKIVDLAVKSKNLK